MTVVIGTAGHVDHGKTALLRALTGIDADRLPEERRRGMTIDVGYAYLALADGSDLDFVDVPGHDRLVGNMLVGVGEVDAVLLVVAADDGPRAQTIEHLELIDALGISAAIVALTKIDAVDPGRVAEVEALVRTILAGTTLENAPILPVSSADRRGLLELVRALTKLRDQVLEQAATEKSPGPPGRAGTVRLAVDRTFVIKGRGPVVSATLRDGRLARGDRLRLVPGDQAVRAREIQVHGATVESLADGGRVAVNLAGVEADELHRGMVLTTDPGVVASTNVVAVLRPGPNRSSLPVAPGWPPPTGSTFRLHLGTEQVEARLGRGRRDWLLLPDRRVVVRLRLARPIAVADCDRFVLRRAAAGAPPIGGMVLDSTPPTGPSRRRMDPGRLAGLAATDPIVRGQALLAVHGVIEPGRLPNELKDGVRMAGLDVDRRLVAELESTLTAEVLGSLRSRAEVRARLIGAIRRMATVSPAEAGQVVDAILVRLVASGRIAQSGDRLHEPGRAIGPGPAVVAAMARLEARLATLAPPALSVAARESGCPIEGIHALETAGRIIRVDDDLAYAGRTYGEIVRTAVQMASTGPLAPGAFRDATGTSRKYVLAILEDLDRRGILRRTPDGHLPGPRSALAAQIGRIES